MGKKLTPVSSSTAFDMSRAIVDDLFDDLLDRRFIKWLFDLDAEGGQVCNGPVDALDPETIISIRRTWEDLVMARLAEIEE